MKILSQCALAGVLFSVVQACAVAVDISGDVQEVNPNSLGDSGVPSGGQGAGGSAGDDGIGQGGSGPSGVGGTGSSGRSGSGGQSGGAGGSIGGAGAGGSLAGGSGGSAGTAGSAGTGGTGSASVFDPDECDFQDQAGCSSCVQRCPADDGGSCAMRCNDALACPAGNTECIVEADPLCRVRDESNSFNDVCSNVADSAGPDAEAFALALVRCLCSVPRPGQ